MITMKNILLSMTIISTTLLHPIEPAAECKKSTMSREEANTIKNPLIATGALGGGATEFAAVWKYAQHSPSTSKARGPLRLLAASVAGVGGIWVGGCAAQEIGDAVAERLMRDDASTSTELLEPQDKDHSKKTEELVIEKS